MSITGNGDSTFVLFEKQESRTSESKCFMTVNILVLFMGIVQCMYVYVTYVLYYMHYVSSSGCFYRKTEDPFQMLVL